jgi:hypothetical protein
MAEERRPAPGDLERLYDAGRLITVDYPYRPMRRRIDESTSKIFELINAGGARDSAFMADVATVAPFFERIPVHGQGRPELEPRWLNGWFPGLDAITLYAMLALNDPRWYVEVGSGNSTMFARQAIRDHGLRTAIISIDPAPRADIDTICDTVIRLPCEDVAAEFFATLSGEDVLFVDNSHRSFQNSDVTVFFTEILPHLPVGIVYGLHDIYLPWDYPDEWRHRFYNEQYLLAAYLLGGANGDEILSPNAFLSLHSPQLLDSLAGVFNSEKLHGIERTGGAFWMRRRAPQT